MRNKIIEQQKVSSSDSLAKEILAISLYTYCFRQRRDYYLMRYTYKSFKKAVNNNKKFNYITVD